MVEKDFEAAWNATIWLGKQNEEKKLIRPATFAEYLKRDENETQKLITAMVQNNQVKVHLDRGAQFLFTKAYYDSKGQQGIQYEVIKLDAEQQERAESARYSEDQAENIQQIAKANENAVCVENVLPCPCGNNEPQGAEPFFAESSILQNTGGPLAILGAKTCSKCGKLLLFGGFLDTRGSNYIHDQTISSLLTRRIPRERFIPHAKVNEFFTHKYNQMKNRKSFV